MADGTNFRSERHTRVPASQIADTRRSFPDRNLVFDVEILGPGWQGIAAAAKVFAEAGLELASLHCSGADVIRCRLKDRQHADLSRLAESIDRSSDLQLQRWTTIIAF